MKPLTVTAHGLTLTLTSSAAGHAALGTVPQQALVAVLTAALAQVVALEEEEPP